MKAKKIREGSERFYDHKPFGNNPGQEQVDRENAQKARRFDGWEYWQEVALTMGGTLGDLDTGKDYRLIRIMHPEFGGIDIDQDWSQDGSPTKPVTKIDTRQDGEELGRFAIWDEASDYAEDLMAIVHQIVDSNKEDVDEAFHLPRNPLRKKGKPGEFKPSKEWKAKFAPEKKSQYADRREAVGIPDLDNMEEWEKDNMFPGRKRGVNRALEQDVNEVDDGAPLTTFTSTDDLCALLQKNPGLKIMAVLDNQMYHYLEGGEENGYFVIREEKEL